MKVAKTYTPGDVSNALLELKDTMPRARFKKTCEHLTVIVRGWARDEREKRKTRKRK